MPPDRELFQRLRLLVAEGLTVDAIAGRVGMDRPATCQALARAGLPIPGNATAGTVITDVLRFFQLWRDPELTVRDIADAMNVSPGSVMRGARRYGLGRRQRMRPDDAEVDPKEEAASCASLDLAPFTASRAAEVQRGWSDHDRRMRVVQQCEPVTYCKGNYT
ncbi:MAG: hypothetical protein EBR82_62505 [Caulobacteraceae bacterium]|nr:hypothetical protein [bacterium]NBW18588.1 hypothetical protein [Caulobacteraceae bacterium]